MHRYMMQEYMMLPRCPRAHCQGNLFPSNQWYSDGSPSERICSLCTRTFVRQDGMWREPQPPEVSRVPVTGLR